MVMVECLVRVLVVDVTSFDSLSEVAPRHISDCLIICLDQILMLTLPLGYWDLLSA